MKNDFVKKISSLINLLTTEKGELNFFCLALREDSTVWDLLVAAAWIDEDRNNALDYLVEKVQSVLTKRELLQLSAIILLENSYFTGHSRLESSTGWEENDVDLYGIAVKKAYIFIASDVDLQIQAVRN